MDWFKIHPGWWGIINFYTPRKVEKRTCYFCKETIIPDICDNYGDEYYEFDECDHCKHFFCNGCGFSCETTCVAAYQCKNFNHKCFNTCYHCYFHDVVLRDITLKKERLKI